ncbi:hypothetical protein FRC11_004244 [Ceratobasidium sp. 423]|nr:hypothetical protein FRC11_004244 [Ceratobasidium sp. 423]
MANSPGSELDPELDPELATIAYHLLAAKYFMLASFIFMVYDHIITFAQEVSLQSISRDLYNLTLQVDRMWQRERTGATWLFALNRYLTELQFIVNLVFAEIILILRTYALYQRNKYILGLLAFFWTGQMIVMGTTMRHPTRVELPEGLAVFKAEMEVMQPLIHVIVRDGVLYFTVILSANLLNCLLYYLAPPSLKVIGASFSQIITVVMISRLQLNLRSESICSTPRMPTSQLPPISSPEFPGKEKQISGTISTLSQYFEATVMDLGKDVMTSCDEEDTKEMETEEMDVQVRGAKCSCSTPKCLCHAFGGEAPVELEMGPIRPVSGRVTMLDTRFTPEESAYLDQVIQISPAIVGERRPSDEF